MIISKENVMYIRLYKQGLIKKFSSFDELINRLEIQAQSEKDMLFNVNARLCFPVTLNEIYLKSIRNWYVRNTLFLVNKNKYSQIVYVNNVIDNWFNKKYLKDDPSLNDFNNIKKICLRHEQISVDKLLSFEINNSFVKNWGGVFIELTKQGLVYSKQRNFIVFNHRKINRNFSMLKIMEDYFKIYGPATLNDFKHWLGVPYKETNKIFNKLPKDYVITDDKLIVHRKDLDLLNNKMNIPTIVLGKFDNICLSYEDKTWLINNQFKSKVWGPAGIVEAIIILDGKIMATWRYKKNFISIRMVENLSVAQKEAIYTKFIELFGKNVKLEYVYEY